MRAHMVSRIAALLFVNINLSLHIKMVQAPLEVAHLSVPPHIKLEPITNNPLPMIIIKCSFKTEKPNNLVSFQCTSTLMQ